MRKIVLLLLALSCTASLSGCVWPWWGPGGGPAQGPGGGGPGGGGPGGGGPG